MPLAIQIKLFAVYSLTFIDRMRIIPYKLSCIYSYFQDAILIVLNPCKLPALIPLAIIT